MWRLLHALGWSLAMGLAVWLVALLVVGLCQHVVSDGDGLIAVGQAVGALLGVAGGLILARATWRPTRLHTVLAHAGGWLALLCGVIGGALLFRAEAVAREQPQMFAGLGEFVLALLAFAIAAIGFGLGLAGISGRMGRPLEIGS